MICPACKNDTLESTPDGGHAYCPCGHNFSMLLRTYWHRRPSWDLHFLRHAKLAAEMSTCVRRSVGCVLIDSRKHIIGIGFNGVPAGMKHCNEGFPCTGANLPSGTGLDECMSAHAELNALLQCGDQFAVDVVYCTTSPCIGCTKMLLNTSARRVVFLDEYPQPTAKKLWEEAGRSWELWSEDASKFKGPA